MFLGDCKEERLILMEIPLSLLDMFNQLGFQIELSHFM